MLLFHILFNGYISPYIIIILFTLYYYHILLLLLHIYYTILHYSMVILYYIIQWLYYYTIYIVFTMVQPPCLFLLQELTTALESPAQSGGMEAGTLRFQVDETIRQW